MRHRLTRAILLLYPRRVRGRHGPEIVALIDDVIAHEERSQTGLFIRLALDGLVQRLASTTTVWTVVAVLAASSVGGLAVSDLAAANDLRAAPARSGPIVPERSVKSGHRDQARPGPRARPGGRSGGGGPADGVSRRSRRGRGRRAWPRRGRRRRPSAGR